MKGLKMNKGKLNYLLEQIEGFNIYVATDYDIKWLTTQCIKILKELTNE